MSIVEDKFKAAIDHSGLDLEQVLLHQRRLKGTLIHDKARTFPVLDTCRISNGGIVKAEHLAKLSNLPSTKSAGEGFIAFIPAAGASSRYYKDLAPLHTALVCGEDDLSEAFQKLPKVEWNTLPLPDAIGELIGVLAKKEQPSASQRDQAIQAFSLPKALQPAVLDQTSYLEIKRIEHAVQTPALCGEVFVVSPKHKVQIAEMLASKSNIEGSSWPVKVMEQGDKLSTIRFDKFGEPIWHEESLSQVPAGHGTLTSLFSDVKDQFPSCHSIWIRNIDNVVGTDPQCLSATKRFLDGHTTMLNILKQVRSHLSENDFVGAAEVVSPLVDLTSETTSGLAGIGDEVRQVLDAQPSDELRILWQTVFGVFHTFPDALQALELVPGEATSLKALFERPLSTLGQVPNTRRDVGGTPVLAKTPIGTVKICLEVPHASEKDQDIFFKDASKATHFNPVFAAIELTNRRNAYQTDASPFWLVAEKPFLGRQVYYHESVLYELVGNSIFANCMFVDIPRCLFNPHKSIFDGENRLLKDWCDQH